ncbi:hypothetical protein OS493_011472 [Desmophyllum pertusum]|uniref:Uncharacterized protein n=1 Tax=Desmophyllum pertusum TaxID=174260 RepID=A0A9W9YQF9_9CNID|nr:hypothetical protein OS493_011472 [Desmophyllum pertusum]
MAAHKSANAKGSHRMNSRQSAYILQNTKSLIPSLPDQRLERTTTFAEPAAEQPALHAESSQEQTRTLVEKDSSNDDRTDSDVSSNGPDGLATELSRLAISVPSPADDETFLSPDTGSIVSSTSEEAQAAKARSVVPREKLNEYLVSDGIAPITQPWLEWEKASDRTKQTIHQ